MSISHAAAANPLEAQKQTAPVFTEASVKRNDEILGLFEVIADEFDEAISDVLNERATRWEPRT